jgi:hypothetical protein
MLRMAAVGHPLTSGLRDCWISLELTLSFQDKTVDILPKNKAKSNGFVYISFG